MKTHFYFQKYIYTMTYIYTSFLSTMTYIYALVRGVTYLYVFQFGGQTEKFQMRWILNPSCNTLSQLAPRNAPSVAQSLIVSSTAASLATPLQKSLPKVAAARPNYLSNSSSLPNSHPPSAAFPPPLFTSTLSSLSPSAASTNSPSPTRLSLIPWIIFLSILYILQTTCSTYCPA